MRDIATRNGRRYLLVAALAFVVGTPAAFAESACKGLEQAACEKKDDCHWVEGYTRKDGVKVSSHCRTSSKGSSKSSGSSSKSSSADKD